MNPPQLYRGAKGNLFKTPWRQISSSGQTLLVDHFVKSLVNISTFKRYISSLHVGKLMYFEETEGKTSFTQFLLLFFKESVLIYLPHVASRVSSVGWSGVSVRMSGGQEGWFVYRENSHTLLHPATEKKTAGNDEEMCAATLVRTLH